MVRSTHSESKSPRELSFRRVGSVAGDGRAGHIGPVLRFALKFSDALLGFLSQGSSFTGDGDLSNAFDMRHATVKRGDELVQMMKGAGAIRLSHPVVT